MPTLLGWASVSVVSKTNNEVNATVTPSYVVVDGRTGEVVSKPYKSRSRASARADKLDNAYGAYRYRVEQR